MSTLLRVFLRQTFSPNLDPVVCAYIETVLLVIKQRGGFTAAPSANSIDLPEQNLLVHVLNRLLTIWNLMPFLGAAFTPSDDEKRILCLSLTLNPCSVWQPGGEGLSSSEITQIRKQYRTIGDHFNFDAFWENWCKYLNEIVYLTQNISPKAAKKPTLKIPLARLNLLLRPLLEFGAICAQLTDPADLVTQSQGDFLHERLQTLGIRRKLIYHRSRNYMGLLTQSIHHAVMRFVADLDWRPILFFAQGIIYLAPEDSELPDCTKLQPFLWEQVSQQLSDRVLQGKVGFKRDGKGLKAAPQTLELFSPAQLIRNLPQIIQSYVRNDKDPATPKRLKKLNLSTAEQELLTLGADLRADRLAEFIILVQKEFFKSCPEFIAWMLEALNLQSIINPELIELQSGGVNLGWYYAAAQYVANNPTLDYSNNLQELAERLASWAEAKRLLPNHASSTREVFYDYVTQYLDIQGWDTPTPSFARELAGYVQAKTKAAKQPICSLSSGEFASEDQMDSVVLFKPQQYSNKNPLGERQIKRGISKIWALEMLLRQAAWSVPASKLEERHPVFLYIFPASLYAPQVAAVLQQLIKEIQGVNLWQVRRHWLTNDMNIQSLQTFPWLKLDQASSEPSELEHSKDFSFVAINYTLAKDRTRTESWVEPAFWALALPMLLGVKVVATSSSVPPFQNSSDLQECARLDGPADFWSMLSLPTTLHFNNWINGRVQTLAKVLNRLMIVYSLHLDVRSDPPDACWNVLNATVQDLLADILNIFQLAAERLRRDNAKHKLTPEEVHRFWHYAQVWAGDDVEMQNKLKVTQHLASEYYKFYRVSPHASSHSILLPLSKALEQILAVPADWDNEEIINQGAGQLKDALDRQEIYKRPLMTNKAIDYEIRQSQEMDAIQIFMTTCVNQLFGEMCRGDRSLLQENRNRIKAGVEFAYCQLALQERQAKANSKQGDEHEYS